jgi:prevent-host-death family protein
LRMGASGWTCEVALGQPLDFARVMVTVMVMQAPIADVKKRLCELVNRVEQGESIVILRHGRPAARLVPMPGRGRPWRVERPDDPKPYRGLDIDEPILEEI